MPGPSPFYQPRFPEEFLAQTRLLLQKRTAAAHLRQRATLVLLLHEQPSLCNAQAAARVGLHPNSVRLWRQRWAQGQFALEDRSGRGRKPSFSPSGPVRRRRPRLRARGADETPLEPPVAG